MYLVFMETWCEKSTDCDGMLDGYTPYGLGGTKKKKRGRCSGGIKVFIKDNISKYFSIIKSKFQHALVFEVVKELFGVNIIYLATYLPPEGAIVYENDETNGVILLEEMLTKLRGKYPNHEVIVTGDLNARTKDDPDYIMYDHAQHLPCQDWYKADNFDNPRRSKDMHGNINCHGKSLLALCCSQDIHMLNGRKTGDMKGEITCFANKGSSVVDYTIVSSTLFPLIATFEILENDSYTHMPQAFHMISASTDPEMSAGSDPEEQEQEKRHRFKWTNNSTEKLISPASQEKINSFHTHLDSENISGAVTVFTEMLQHVCEEQKPRDKTKNIPLKNSPWWDMELENLKKQKYKCLRLLRLEHSKIALDEYKNVRSKFKNLIRKKKLEFHVKMKYKIENCDSTAEFWKVVKSYKERKTCVNSITAAEWKDYFKMLLNNENDSDVNHCQHVNEYMEWHKTNCEQCKDGDLNVDLNCNVKMSEVENIVKCLAKNKSPGIDGIVNECIKMSSPVVLPLLCELFNKIFECGTFPDSWCNALIIPIHKKGPANDPGNYRGIALLSCISKIFTKLINERLIKWENVNNKMFEVQGGFTKGKSTVDQIFILQALITNISPKRKVDATQFLQTFQKHLIRSLTCIYFIDF